jgi:hypothetical protein
MRRCTITPVMVAGQDKVHNRVLQPWASRAAIGLGSLQMLQGNLYCAKGWCQAFLGMGGPLLLVLSIRSLRRTTGRKLAPTDEEKDVSGEGERAAVVPATPGAKQSPPGYQRGVGSPAPRSFLWEDRRSKDASTRSPRGFATVKFSGDPTHAEAFVASMTFADSSLRPPSCPCCQ